MKKLTQEQIISQFDKANKAYDKAETNLRNYFKDKFLPIIKTAKTLEELNNIKEQLRVIPDETVTKVLLFRAIIMSEDIIKGLLCKTCLLEKNKCSCK